MAIGVLSLVAGCASSSGGAGGSSGGSAAGNTPNLLTEQEIKASNAENAYEVIWRLRPSFLRTRGAMQGSTTPGEAELKPVEIMVYLDETRLGGTDQLRQIPLMDVSEIRYFSASDATTMWGVGHSAGAIQIRSRR
jgi:hypothetical protein